MKEQTSNITPNWDESPGLNFNGSTYLSIDDYSSKIFLRSLKEYDVIKRRYWELFTLDNGFYEMSIDEFGVNYSTGGSKWKYSETKKRKCSEKLNRLSSKLTFGWINLHENMQQFADIYFDNIEVPTSNRGPYLRSAGSDDAQWCSSHLMGIDSKIREMIHVCIMEEKAVKSVRYSIIGVIVGTIGFLVGLYGLM
ncbi:MAG: hypothetical protein M0P07_06015 [Candidatus Methanomethylophilaceae archaeon]|jgi:hypothetical protein|nr:hypothetical protein [Candidatus Methanomethylophilaceae archaeon]